MPPRLHQKRPASSEAGPSSQSTSKRTRFVEPSEDPGNFAQEVDAALENPSAARKGRVNTEGYDSDSSDDGEGVVLSRRPGGEDAAEDEDDDMFTTAHKEEKKPAPESKSKPEFLRLGDIEGQEFDGESEEESGEEDEDDAERRKKAGMGFELSSFNMREEMEEGKFSADGTYVRTFDPHALHDRWMEGLDEREIKQARRRKRQQEKLQKEMMKAEERELEEMGGKEAVEREMVGMLKKGETVLEALQRLGTQARKGSDKKSLDSMDEDKSKAPKVPSDIDHLTHLASTLLSLGDTDIYSKTYEELVRSVRSAGKVGPTWVPPSADVQYEYKWDVPEPNGETFGPFSEDDMQAWFKASYFGSMGEKIKLRAIGGQWTDWGEIF
ncbi:hypothetical protein HETIRDRAFT_309595 [Heterobasidion irregulare TC 32-1]|uniref:GYF domain-containing protein n=1 Tax=Heterobasidion irregulare (strain TC 32-1) TaxID=747525 RepID=W4KJ18_HETIT|nr:uncharacterized protein HETIRDRAFT_309595 [Heterobasidion irregulare TC 32-1]ETW85837.1 hypothetical protein HETIRDRAFT_309595 [Heterobasidion irregulare TC 32-1]